MERLNLKQRWPRGRIALVIAACSVVAFSVLVAEQATEWSSNWPVASLLWWVGGTTLVLGLILVAVAMYLCMLTRSWLVRCLIVIGLSAIQSWVRTGLLLPSTISEQGTVGETAIFLTGLLGYCFALGTGLLVAGMLEREDAEREQRIDGQRQLRESVAELEQEEMRIRQIVADRLHGTVQYRLVTIASGLDLAAAQLEQLDQPVWSRQLRAWSEELDELRETQVRTLSHTLFPSGADLSTYDALRTLLDRLPVTVNGSIKLGARMQEAIHRHRALLPLIDRLVVIYTVEEAITNAIKHGNAQQISIQADLHEATGPQALRSPWILEMAIDDDGSGPKTANPEFSGLARHQRRAQMRGGSLCLGRNEQGGGRLQLRLPFTPVAPIELPEPGPDTVSPEAPGGI